MFTEILTEIVTNIEIEPDFIVRHPDYPPLDNPLPNIPLQLQAKYSLLQLQTYLYDIYFSHSLQPIATTAAQPDLITNNLVDGVDIDFCRSLDRHNHSHGYFDPDWQILAVTEQGAAIVVKDGLHLHLDPQWQLPPDCQTAVVGDFVPIYLPHNLVECDRYVAVGDRGCPISSPAIELYFNFTPDAAIAILSALTTALNQASIPFQFAILHDPALFYRYDAGRLRLSQVDYLTVGDLLMQVYRSHQAEFSPQVPLFTKSLARGLGIAEVPPSGNFGMQRCELLAQGLLAAAQGGYSLADRVNLIRQEFITAGIRLPA